MQGAENKPTAPLRPGVEFQEKDFDSVGKEVSSNFRPAREWAALGPGHMGGGSEGVVRLTGAGGVLLLGQAFATEQSARRQTEPVHEGTGVCQNLGVPYPALLPVGNWDTSSASGEKAARCPNAAHTI